ncbi:MAG: hypothetical protein AAGA54_37085, partial [Myxococcota bacterium]
MTVARCTVAAALLLLAPGCDKLTDASSEDGAPAEAPADEAEPEAEGKSEDDGADDDVGTPMPREDVPPEAPPNIPGLTCASGTTAHGGAPPTGNEAWCEKPASEGGVGVRHGRFIRWHDGTEQKWREGDYQDGKRHGPWTTWHEGGKKADEGEYAN